MPDLRVIDKLSEDFPESWNKSSSKKIAEQIAQFLLKNNVEVDGFDVGKFVLIIKTSNNPERIARQIISFKKIDNQSEKFKKNITEIIEIEFEKQLQKDIEELDLNP